MITGYYEDIAVGQTFRSNGRTINEAYVMQFAMLTGDWHPLHTDVEYARKGAFGQPISHGMLTLAVATGLMTLSPESVKAFYGMDRVRFLRPVVFGDTITVLTEVADRGPLKQDSGVIELKVTVVNQREEPVLAAQLKFLVRSRSSEALVSSRSALA